MVTLLKLGCIHLVVSVILKPVGFGFSSSIGNMTGKDLFLFLRRLMISDTLQAGLFRYKAQFSLLINVEISSLKTINSHAFEC